MRTGMGCSRTVNTLLPSTRRGYAICGEDSIEKDVSTATLILSSDDACHHRVYVKKLEEYPVVRGDLACAC